jgi:Protein of unknown function (DUF2971)
MNDSDKDSKTIPTPKFLFRYLRDDANLLETLATPYLWFSSPDSLNDPFDLTNVLDSNTTDENLDWYINKYGGKYFPDKELKIKESLQDKELKKKMAAFWQLLLAETHKAYLDRVAVCCFSFVNNSPLMWSHYSGGHTGVCLVIDAKRFVADFSLIKVDYKKNLPKWNIIDTRKQWGVSMEYNRNFDQVVLGTKYQEWEYEQEYRLISPNRGKHKLYPESVLGVIFGAKMPLDRRNDIKEKIKNIHSNFHVIDASLEISKGQVVVNGFNNSIENLPIGGWRYLSDPKGEFRDLSGNLLTNEHGTAHERTLSEPWIYKYKITYAEPSYGTENFEQLDEKLDEEINYELMSKYLLNGKFLLSKHSEKVISINEYFQELINFALSGSDHEKLISFKINEEIILSFSGEPQYYVECSKGKLDIIAMGFRVIFTQFVDYSRLKTSKFNNPDDKNFG